MRKTQASFERVLIAANAFSQVYVSSVESLVFTAYPNYLPPFSTSKPQDTSDTCHPTNSSSISPAIGYQLAFSPLYLIKTLLALRCPRSRSLTRKGIKLSLVLAIRRHLIQHPLGNFKGLHARRHTTIHGRVQQCLANLKLSQAVVDGAADMHAKLGPALDGCQDANVYVITVSKSLFQLLFYSENVL